MRTRCRSPPLSALMGRPASAMVPVSPWRSGRSEVPLSLEPPPAQVGSPAHEDDFLDREGEDQRRILGNHRPSGPVRSVQGGRHRILPGEPSFPGCEDSVDQVQERRFAGAVGPRIPRNAPCSTSRETSLSTQVRSYRKLAFSSERLASGVPSQQIHENGAPQKAVTTPTGISDGASRVREGCPPRSGMLPRKAGTPAGEGGDPRPEACASCGE
jgi:hypothetical protein